MPELVNLVRPDGSVLQTTPERAARLKELGSDLQEESLSTEIQRSGTEAVGNYYEGQKLETFAEGVASGLTLGGYDYIAEHALDWDTSERAQYNPGTRLAGEIVGGVAPALVPGGGAAVLAKTPAGMLSAGAARAGAAVGGSTAKRYAVAGAVEGAVQGAAAVGVNATLSGDPLTAEAVLAGVGVGTIVGGGLGGILGKASDAAETYSAKRAASKLSPELPDAPPELVLPPRPTKESILKEAIGQTPEIVDASDWGSLHGTVKDATSVIDESIKTVESRIASTTVDKNSVVGEVDSILRSRDHALGEFVAKLDAEGKTAGVRGLKERAYNTLAEAKAAAKKGDFDTFEAVMNRHTTEARELEDAVNATASDVALKNATEQTARETLQARREQHAALLRDIPGDDDPSVFGHIAGFERKNISKSTDIAKEALKDAERAFKDKDWALYEAALGRHAAATSEIRESLVLRMDDFLESRGETLDSLMDPSVTERYQRLLEAEPVAFKRPSKTDISSEQALNFQRVALKRIEDVGPALEELRALSTVRDSLRSFPTKVEGLIDMAPGKFEEQKAAVVKLLSGVGGAEMQGIRDSVSGAIDGMVAKAGVKVDGGYGDKLQALREHGKAVRKFHKENAKAITERFQTDRLAASDAYTNANQKWRDEVDALKREHKAKVAAYKEQVKLASSGESEVIETTDSLGRRVFKHTLRAGAGRTAKHAAGAKGLSGIAAYSAGSGIVGALLAAKTATTGALSDGVARWAPRITRAAAKVNAPGRVDPLRTRLDGSVDKGKKDRTTLMRERAEEFQRNAATIRETLYRSLAPLAAEHGDFVVAMLDTAEKQFQALAARIPRDPGTAFSRMQSMWKPDNVTIEKFARAYEVFQNPVAVTRRALETGSISPEAATALREFNPELFQVLRVSMIERLAEPGNLQKLTYGEQVSLGRLLNITIHSTQTPRFIAAQQAMFQERNQPLAVRPPGGSTSNNPSGGRPPGASAASAITEH